MTSPTTVARGLRARTPLRVQLIALLLLLTTAAVVVVALTSSTVLRRHLLAEKNAQLSDYVQQASSPRGMPRRGLDGPDDGVGLNRESAVIVTFYDAAGLSLANGNPAAINDDVALPKLPALTLATAKSREGRPFSVDAETGGGRWRALVRVTPLTDRTTGITFPGFIVVSVPIDDVDSTVAQLLRIDLITGLVVLALLAALATYAVRAGMRPLAQVQHTAEAIASGDLSHRVPLENPHTEVGRLAGAFNAMVDRIELSFSQQEASESQARASEERMRRFVGDASHELRTPLTSIRGFAELYRMGAVQQPQDLARVMGRIESEARRMGLLVEDLLLLARLDQQRPLRRESVDMLTLARDAVHDAGAIDGGSHPVSLHEAGERATTVIGDEARLRQVLTNLVGNAVAHTPAGTPIDVRVGAVDDDVLVEVRDAGPGLAPEEAARVFERFYRADSSRSRSHDESDAAATTGSGLGLSIVAALVAAHGGRVELRTAPGQGAAFLVRLPPASPELVSAPAH